MNSLRERGGLCNSRGVKSSAVPVFSEVHFHVTGSPGQSCDISLSGGDIKSYAGKDTRHRTLTINVTHGNQEREIRDRMFRPRQEPGILPA